MGSTESPGLRSAGGLRAAIALALWVPLAGPVQAADADGDGIEHTGQRHSCTGGDSENCDDNCPSLPNPLQGDADGDGVGDACDNCIDTFNPRWRGGGSLAAFSGNQLDSNRDGFGNLCDADFDGDGLVGASDFHRFRRAFSMPRDGYRCPEVGRPLGSCAEFDLDGRGKRIDAEDFLRFTADLGRPPGPKCPACPLLNDPLPTPPGFGIENHVGSEETLEAIYGLQRLQRPERPAGYRTFFVSAQPQGFLPEGFDDDPGTFAAPIRSLDRVLELVDELGCGLEFVFDRDTWAGGAFGRGLHTLVPTCSEADEVSIYLRALDPDHPPVFDCTGGTPQAGVVRAVAGPDAGWVVAENIAIASCADDGFDTVGANAKMLTLNSGAEVSGGGNQAFTPHNTSRMISLNGWGSSRGANALGPGGEATLVVISRGRFSSPHSALISGGNNEVFVIGAELTSEPGGAGGEVVKITSQPGFSRLTMIRPYVHDPAGGRNLLFAAREDDSRTEIRLHQATFASSAGGGISLSPSGPESSIGLFARCLLMDEIERAQLFTPAGSLAKIDVDIRNSIFDDDDAPTSWRIEGLYLENLSQALAVQGGAWSALFDDAASFESGGPGVDGIQWDGDDDLATPEDTNPDRGCHPNQACFRACDAWIEEPMPVPLPAFVLGERVDAWRLGGPGSNIGAR